MSGRTKSTVSNAGSGNKANVDESAVKIRAVKPALKSIDPTMTVEVKSNFYGDLYYKSSVTGFIAEWSSYGDINLMTVAELQNMRNSQRRFFTENWITLEGDDAQDVLTWLQVDKYYKSIASLKDIDDVFKWSASRIESEVPGMSSGVKNSIAIRAYELIESGELDRMTVIKAIEKATDCELLEK